VSLLIKQIYKFINSLKIKNLKYNFFLIEKKRKKKRKRKNGGLEGCCRFGQGVACELP
jgi:predicted nucleotidyltransferase